MFINLLNKSIKKNINLKNNIHIIIKKTPLTTNKQKTQNVVIYENKCLKKRNFYCVLHTFYREPDVYRKIFCYIYHNDVSIPFTLNLTFYQLLSIYRITF